VIATTSRPIPPWRLAVRCALRLAEGAALPTSSRRRTGRLILRKAEIFGFCSHCLAPRCNEGKVCATDSHRLPGVAFTREPKQQSGCRSALNINLHAETQSERWCVGRNGGGCVHRMLGREQSRNNLCLLGASNHRLRFAVPPQRSGTKAWR